MHNHFLFFWKSWPFLANLSLTCANLMICSTNLGTQIWKLLTWTPLSFDDVFLTWKTSVMNAIKSQTNIYLRRLQFYIWFWYPGSTLSPHSLLVILRQVWCRSVLLIINLELMIWITSLIQFLFTLVHQTDRQFILKMASVKVWNYWWNSGK